MVEKSAKLGHLRIVIVKGRLYFEKKGEVFQTRDVVTIWGILQMLRLYPGRVPDLEMVMNCNDRTTVKRKDYGSDASGFSVPPPLFHYCSDQESFDIVFPDWSFWGWPEINIKPWEELQEELEMGNARTKWRDREPFAYWKGNAGLGSARNKLVTCNATKEQDWNARIFNMDWKMEKQQGFSNSNLSCQCSHRYKIYAEGNSWSVSQKYILFCDSMTLMIKPHFYDFFSRSLVPTIHYWPIEDDNMCDSIRFAVEWGNNHPEKAEKIGKAGSKFVKSNLRMKYIYDYMFYLMNEYSKLMKYKPRVPKEVMETCSETLICSDIGQKRRFKKHSMVKSSSDSSPCELPSPYEDDQIRAFVDRKEALMKLVLSMEEGSRMAV